MAIAFEDASSIKWGNTYIEAGQSFVYYYFRCLLENKENFDYLTDELDNLILAHETLVKKGEDKDNETLLDFTRLMAPFLKQRAFLSVLLNFCKSAIVACESIGTNSGWVHFLEYEAHYALGDWNSALGDIQAAITVSHGKDLGIYAQAVLSLGRLKLNQGYYQEALEILGQAEHLLLKQKDFEGLASAKAEEAAYYLNRDELDKALELYLEADRIYRQSGTLGPTDHTLLMLGVVYRRRGEYAKAIQYLQELLEHGKGQKNNNAIAAASHHLAWTFLNKGNLIQAKALGEEAKRLYQKNQDPRGESDAYEQLGLIAITDGDKDKALNYLKQSLYMRRILGNRHGVTSCIRRLALIYFRSGDFLRGIAYLAYGLFSYWRLGMLSRQRLRSILNEFKRPTF